MARAITWAIRVTLANGRTAFLRDNDGPGALGHGPIATFYSKAVADAAAGDLRKLLPAGDTAIVIERSHGRQL